MLSPSHNTPSHADPRPSSQKRARHSPLVVPTLLLVLTLLAGSALGSAQATGSSGFEPLTASPPVLSVADVTTYVTNSIPALVAPALTIIDSANQTIDSAYVMITTGLDSTADGLSMSGSGNTDMGVIDGLSWSYNAHSGVMMITGSATTSAYQSVLRKVTFFSSADMSERTVQFSLGGALPNPDNGHFYEFVTSPAITWLDARDAAATRSYFGQTGYLVTVTSAAEQEFVAAKLSGKGWMGATDSDVDKVWRWVTGPEGLEDGGKGRIFFYQGGYSDTEPSKCGQGAAATQPDNQYTNWDKNEPNDWRVSKIGCANGEDYAHFFKSGLWNDFANTTSVEGYVTEYGGIPGDQTPQISGTATVKITTTTSSPVLANLGPTSGEATGGTTVTINGTNLSGATAVNFGGVDAVIVSKTDTQIVVTTPAHAAGLVTVNVITPDGTASLADSFTYTAQAVPTTDVNVTQSYKLTNLAQITLTITVHNNGPDAASGVIIQSAFPAAFPGTAWSWTCTAHGGAGCGAPAGTGDLNEILGALPPDGDVVFTVTGTLANWSNWFNSVVLTLPNDISDSNLADNSTAVGQYQTLLLMINKN